MDTAIRSKGQFKRSFDAKLVELDSAIADNTVTVLQLRVVMVQLEQKWRSLERAFDEIIGLLNDAATSDPENSDILNRLGQEYTERDQYNDEFLHARVAAEYKIENLTVPPAVPATPTTPNVTSNQSVLSTTNLKVKLPTLELKTFSGNILEWRSFAESFNNAVHANTQLDDEQKFNYLRGVLKGDALKEVECLSLTAASYTKAVDILQRRYNRPELVIQGHMNQLYQLTDARNVTDTASLRHLYTEVIVHVRELEALGQDIRAFGGFVVTILLKKLPYELRFNWSKDKTRSLTDLEALLAFIQDDLDTRDCCELMESQQLSNVATAISAVSP